MTPAGQICDYLVECLESAPEQLAKEKVIAMIVYIKILKLDFELSKLEEEVGNEPS